MSRRRAETAGVQLFPFLDVLLSAMGALILLLAVASRNLSKQETELIADAPAAEELRVRKEMVDWETEQLAVQRDKTAADLAEQRSKLGHLEQHARQLRKELSELARAEQQLVAAQDNPERDDKTAELRELRSRLAAARNELDAALEEQANAEPTYAVIPYQGPNETRRRPIYIECRADEIVLQPEGVVLTDKDFDGPLGPGNPLAAAIRAAREHLSRLRHSSEGDAGEPYPLLLVRPEGIETFYAARAALDSWGSEFGYEFIEADWKVSYQPADTTLATVEQDAVDNAREQMRLVAQFAPRINRNVTARTYRAARGGGGVVAVDGGGPPPRRSLGNDFDSETRGGFSTDRGSRGGGSDDEWANSGNGGGAAGRSSNSGRYGSAFADEGGYGSGSGAGDSPLGGGGGSNSAYRSALESVQARRSQAAAGQGASSLAGSGSNSAGMNATNQYGAGGRNGAAGNSANTSPAAPGGAYAPGGNDAAGADGAYTTNAGESGNGGSGSGQPGSDSAGGPELTSSGNGTGGSAGEGGKAGGQQAPGVVGLPAGGSSSGGSPSQSAAAGPAGMPQLGAQFGDSSGQIQQSANQQDRQQSSRSSSSQSPFDTAGRPKGTYQSSRSGQGGSMYGKRPSHRGQNWGLPESGPSAVPLARPIRVECREDRIIVVAERGANMTSRVIKLGPRTEESVDEFVSAIWDHMERWGIAGDGFYWHPIIKLETIGGGAERANELKSLLANSGLEIRDPAKSTDTVRRAMSHSSR